MSGFGTNNNGDTEAFFLDLTGARFIRPIPEPSSLDLLALGCAEEDAFGGGFQQYRDNEH